MKKQNVLVTGGAGFIGSHLAERLLDEGYHVTVIDNLSTGRLQNIENFRTKPNFRFHQKDITEFNQIKDLFSGIDIVFHVAALADIVPSIQDPVKYFRSNVDGTMNVMEAARLAGVSQVLYAASSSCYGIPDHYPTPETAPLRPQYPYALTKALGEQVAFHWGQVYKLTVNSVRFFNVYGPRSRTSGSYGAVFGVFLAQKIHGKPFTIVGDGTQTRDFVYVTDVVKAMVKVVESDFNGEIFNIGSGHPVSVNKIADLLKGKDRVNIPKRPGEPDSTHADISKIQRMLDWAPEVSIEEGVATMLENINYWREAPVWTPDTIADATKEWFQYLGEKKFNHAV